MTDKNAYYRLGFKIFADFSGVIAVPAVLGALFGKWLDARYQTHPRYLLILLFLALLSTAVMIVRKAKKYKSALEDL